MKKIIYTLLLNLVLIATVYGQAGTISFHENMYAVTSKTWNIDIKEAKAVRITYAIDIGLTDYLVFFDLSSSGAISSAGVPVSGYCTGTYITTTKTGKAQITIFNSSLSVIKNIDIQYCADNSIETKNDLNVGGNATITGTSTVNGNATIMGTCTVNGKTYLNGTVGGNVPGGALRVQSSYGYVDIGPQNVTFANIQTDRGEFAFDKPITLVSGSLASYTNTDLTFKTSRSTPRMTILNSNGFVGIGTTIPSTKATVSGTLTVDALGQSLNQYSEGIRLGAASDGYSIVTFGANPAVASGAQANQWWVGKDGRDNGFNIWGNSHGDAFHILPSGFIGIGTTTPNAKLESVSGVNANPATGNTTQSGAALRLRGGDNAVLDFGMNSINTWIQATDQSGLNQTYKISLNPNGGNVGIGTISPLTRLDVQTASNQHVQITQDLNGNLPGCVGIVSINDGNTAYTPLGFYASKYYFGNGNVSIGTTLPDPTNAMLTVNGTIHAKEVLVDVNIPADYVFKPSYKLMPLNEVEQYVKTNSHLPEIKSAEEITKNGMSMGEMQNKLLQKVEELTLYMIEQQKTITQQSVQINQQSEKIKELEKKLQ